MHLFYIKGVYSNAIIFEKYNYNNIRNKLL